MIMKTIWGIVGMPGSGKSQAISYAKDFAPVVVMGDVIREETISRGLDITPENLGKISQELRKIEGKAAIASRCMKKIISLPENIIIVDGIRSMFEVDEFRKQFRIIIIAIHTSDNIRHARLQSRNRADDSINLQTILERDNRELGFGLREVIENADYVINNNGTFQELESQCRKLFQQLAYSKITKE